MNKPVLTLKLSLDIVTVSEFRRDLRDGEIKLVFIHLTRADSLGCYASVVYQDDTVRELCTESRTRKHAPSIDVFVSFLTLQCGYRGDIVILGSTAESLFEVKGRV